MIILPTHSCFDDALEYMAAAYLDDPVWASEHLRIVHGLCFIPDGPQKDKKFSHGWVEQDRILVIQAGIVDGQRCYYVMSRREHYRLMRVEVSTVYTMEELLRPRPAPMESSYLAYCRDYQGASL